MSIKTMRNYTGMSRVEFSKMFNIPLYTLKDWENNRRKAPDYVESMIKEILINKGLFSDEGYIKECERRKASVDRAVAVALTATKGPNVKFKEALYQYIFGELTLDEMNRKIDRLEYL